MNRVLDAYGYTRDSEGWIILKNGEFFLRCTGTEKAAKHIVETLQKDGEKHDSGKH